MLLMALGCAFPYRLHQTRGNTICCQVEKKSKMTEMEYRPKQLESNATNTFQCAQQYIEESQEKSRQPFPCWKQILFC